MYMLGCTEIRDIYFNNNTNCRSDLTCLYLKENLKTISLKSTTNYVCRTQNTTKYETLPNPIVNLTILGDGLDESPSVKVGEATKTVGLLLRPNVIIEDGLKFDLR